MKGEILHYADGEAKGFIAGDDGNRYEFSPADMKQLRSVAKGQRVDFKADGDQARDIFVLDAAPVGAAAMGAYAAPSSKVPAGHPSMRHKLGNPWAYFKKCLSLYADGKGRAGVAEYWSFALFQFLVTIPFYVIAFADPGLRNQAGEPGALFFIGILGLVLVGLALVIPAICVAVRRLHDLGMSGWLYLLVLVPYLGGLFLFVCSLIPSKEEPNEHGPSPKNPGTVGDVFA